MFYYFNFVYVSDYRYTRNTTFSCTMFRSLVVSTRSWVATAVLIPPASVAVVFGIVKKLGARASHVRVKANSYFAHAHARAHVRRPLPRPRTGAGAYRKLQIKVILILPVKTTVRVNVTVLVLEMATGRVARGPARAGPENPGPRALWAQTGLNFFNLRVLCATANSNFC